MNSICPTSLETLPPQAGHTPVIYAGSGPIKGLNILDKEGVHPHSRQTFNRPYAVNRLTRRGLNASRNATISSSPSSQASPPVAPALRPTGWPAPHPDPAVPPVVAARPARSGTPRSRPQARNGSPAPYSDKAPALPPRSAAPSQGPNPHAPPPSAHPRASRQASPECHQLQSALRATGGGFYSASPCTNRG